MIPISFIMVRFVCILVVTLTRDPIGSGIHLVGQSSRGRFKITPKIHKLAREIGANVPYSVVTQVIIFNWKYPLVGLFGNAL